MFWRCAPYSAHGYAGQRQGLKFPVERLHWKDNRQSYGKATFTSGSAVCEKVTPITANNDEGYSIKSANHIEGEANLFCKLFLFVFSFLCIQWALKHVHVCKWVGRLNLVSLTCDRTAGGIILFCWDAFIHDICHDVVEYENIFSDLFADCYNLDWGNWGEWFLHSSLDNIC